MSKTRLVFNSAGFKEILNSDGTHKMIEDVTNQIAVKANGNYGGNGFNATTLVGGYGGGRWIGFVTATDKDSLTAESEDSALTRALQ